MLVRASRSSCSFFFNDTATTEIYTLSLHDALPICRLQARAQRARERLRALRAGRARLHDLPPRLDRLPVRAHDRRGARSGRLHAPVRRRGLRGPAPARSRGDALMRLHRFLLPLAALAASVAAGCGGAGEDPEPVAATEVEMVKSYRFEPKVIEI